MTTLEITPKISDKTARFRGTVAAGEHVAVTIKGGAEWLGDDNGAHLSLRVLDLVTGRTLAIFPRPPETISESSASADEWSTAGEDDTDLFCNLNLNTDRMVNAARHMLRVPVLFVMGAKDDENPATTRTLYFRDRYEVEFWPERVGDDTPYDLDRWPKQIDEWTELVAEFGTRLTTAETNIEQAVGRADAAIAAIPQTVATAVAQSNSGKADKVANATGGNLAALDANGNLTDSGKKPADFADAAQFAAHKDNTDIHFTAAERAKLNGVAVGAQVNVIEAVKRNGVALPVTGKAVNITVPTKTSDLQNDGDGNSPFATTRALNNEVSRAQGVESVLKADVTSAQSAILNRYTKAETDALVSGAVSGVFVVAQSLPATGEANKIYLVPKSGAETGDVRDEYVWVNGAWELIGSTRVDLSGYYDKMAADGRFVQKEAGKGLSSNDYTTTEKQKLGGIEAGANKTVVDAALSGTSTNPVQNKTVKAALDVKLSKSEAEAGVTEWKYANLPAGATITVPPTYVGTSAWDFVFAVGSVRYEPVDYASGDEGATNLEWVMMPDDGESPEVTVTATRTRLPTMADMPLLANTPLSPQPQAQLMRAMNPHLAFRIDGVSYLVPQSSKVVEQLLALEASFRYALVTPEISQSVDFLPAALPIMVDGIATAHPSIAEEGDGFRIDDSADIICTVNPDGTFGELNENFETITFGGVTPVPGETQVLSVTRSATLADRASNRVTVPAAATSVTLTFPPAVTGHARDFIVRLVVTGETVPEIAFKESDGTDVVFDADDDSWADIEQGVNLLMFTDTGGGAA